MRVGRTSRHTALIAALACTILALGCGLGSVAVNEGALTPPNINLDLGSMRVVGIRSNSPDCTRLVVPGCIGLEPANVAHIYTIWLFQQREHGTWSQPSITHLFSVRVGRAR